MRLKPSLKYIITDLFFAFKIAPATPCSCCNLGNRRDRIGPQCRAEVAHDTDHDRNFARHRWFSRVCNSHQRYAAKLSKKFLYEVPKGR